ncbi:MAG: YigZ family protein [Lachnospiraceae bacterium]|nr:YigZ family protein [Lachnospiraceae bacterium]
MPVQQEKQWEIYTAKEAEIVEKKSRFIAAFQTVHTEEEALAFVAAKKKEHYSARHNCFAYIIGPEDEIKRFSDDGEPSQTAGRPMMDVLEGAHLHNVVVVVTRYFGGVLLGTGGLVRAYQGAVSAGVEACTLIEKTSGTKLSITTDYNGYGKIEYLLRERGILILNTEYDADVTIHCVVERDEDIVETEITDRTAGTAKCQWGERMSYGIVDGNIVYL